MQGVFDVSFIFFLFIFISSEIFSQNSRSSKLKFITSNTTVQNDTYFRPKNRYQPNSFVVLGH